MSIKSKTSPIRYDVHPGVAMVQKWEAELPTKTGRTLEEWAELVRGTRLETSKEKREWLKANHGLGTNTAWWIAGYSEGVATWDGNPELYLANAAKYVDGMYSGAKAGLRPIFEKLVQVGRKLGKDVKVCPCKTIVPLYRYRVFAEIKPATKTRIDLSFALGERPETERLMLNMQKVKAKDRLIHRVAVTSLRDIDDELIEWFRDAYELDEKDK